MNNLHAIDIAVIIGYLILCLVIGLYKAGKIKTIREYTLGTGYISTTVLIFTIFATYIGAGSTVGTVEKIHSMGLIFAVTLLLQPLFWFITAKIFASNIHIFKKAGCMSVSDIMGALYGQAGKWVTNGFSIFLSIGMIAAQIGAIGYLFNYFLGISHLQGVVIGFGVLVIYSLFGGIRAVALTDTFQGLVILVAIPVACAIAFHEIGGYNGMLEKLPLSHISIEFTEANSLFLASMIFYGLLPVSEGTFIQRFLMATDSDQLNKALKVVAIISLPLAIIIGMIGFLIKAKAPEIDPNIAFFYLIGHYLPIGITGLLITGILAAIMSTADSWLNTTSVLCAHDIAKGLFPKLNDRQELLIARFSVLVISGLSATLALANPSLMGLLWMAGNFWFPIVLIPMAAGFLRLQTNQQSFIASAICGVLGVMLGRYIIGEFATISLLLGAISSAIGLFGMHYWQVLNKEDISNDLFSKYNSIATITNNNKNPFSVSKQFKGQITRYKDYGYLLSGLGMIYFLGSSFFMAFSDMKILYVVVYLKAAAAILCFGLSIYELHLTQKQQAKYMPTYWNLVLLYCFPFLSTYIALVYNGSMPWMINLMLSAILLYVFSGWFSMIFLSLIGFAAAYLLFKFTGYSLATLDTGDQPRMLGYIYCFLTAGIIMILKQRDILQEKELQTRVLYGAAIAHEVINPLQGSAMIADTLLNTFKGKRAKDIKEKDFEDIKALLRPFKETSTNALKTVDRILTLVRTDISEADDIGMYAINDCVESTLKSYNLSEKRLARINVNKNNSFKFKGSKHFVGHVIANLISNALKYAGPQSSIEIWYENNKLHFKDNGYGIAPEKLPYIFEPFDKKGSTIGTGVGLPFCKRVMESMGGSIECTSELGKGTEFVLRFGDN
ncbi:MAG: putative periplasmic sensor histidine kinase [Candidatus Midichloriaceae bacterium]|jgi:Na+/proline symporter/signal transduction histidine kinase|nr:putative periplasmic sensor histidine kinase [Candidatus Midichloriaceae bacterium]